MIDRALKIFLMAALLPLNGWQRAGLLRRMRYFHNLGERCYFAISNFGNEPYLIEFGDNVWVAAGVRFVNHDVSARMIGARHEPTRQYDRMGCISIGSNVFLGLNVVVLPGVNICDDVVVGAGCVVSRNIETPGVYIGSPPKLIMTIESYEEKLADRARVYPWIEHLGRISSSRLKQMRSDFFWHAARRGSTQND